MEAGNKTGIPSHEPVCEGRPTSTVTFRDTLLVWVKVELNSFGGPAGQIAVMHRYLVEEKKWISESRFLHALNYCMLLPGPETRQPATCVGRLKPGEMLEGLGLAETTPGPLILALHFASFFWRTTEPGFA